MASHSIRPRCRSGGTGCLSAESCAGGALKTLIAEKGKSEQIQVTTGCWILRKGPILKSARQHFLCERQPKDAEEIVNEHL